MTKVLLTGGSGFIGAHVLKTLAAHGHEVVTTVRSSAKGDFLVKTNPGQKVSYVIVEDIAAPGAFDKAVQATPPFEAVIHTASPFHYKNEDNKRDFLDPAINGTTGILQAIKAHAPSVRRVVITSSFAAIINPKKHLSVYDESVWNPMTWDETLTAKEGADAYRGSKKFAEKAAWDFVENEKPNFDLATINPPFVYGPIVHDLKKLEDLNESNKRILGMIRGDPPVATAGYVDVRDLAEAHVKAMELPEAGGKRFFVTAQQPANGREMLDALGKSFPQLEDKLSKDPRGDDLPYKLDNSRSKEVLGIQYRPIEPTVVDLAKQLLDLGA